jgi:EmrB/QacA subfamily drug resistance transporter
MSTERPSGWGLALLTTVIGAFMAILDSSIVNVAIPTIMNVFGATTTDVEWVVTVYLLALGVVVPLSGWLGDRMGMKRLYIASLLVFTLGSALSGLAPSLGFLVVARVIQALGGGMIMPVTMSMVYRMVPRERIGTAMGIWGLALLLAPAIGPTIGGYLVEYVDWRWIFTINIPIGIIGSALAASALPDFHDQRKSPLDVPGALASSVGLFALLFALTEGGTWGWGSEAIVYLFYIAFVALAFFVVWELYGTKHPLLDLRVFRYTSFTASILIGVVISIGMFSGVFFVPLFLQTVRGLSPFQTGLVLMPGALASGILMPVTGRLYDRFGARPLGLVGLVLLTIGTYLFHRLSTDIPTGQIVWYMMLRGLAMGISMMPVTTAGMSVIPQALISRASALQNITQRVSSSFGIAVLTSILTAREALYYDSARGTLTLAHPAVLELVLARGVSAVDRLLGTVLTVSLVHAMDDLFIIGAAITIVGLVPLAFLRGIHGRRGAPGVVPE